MSWDDDLGPWHTPRQAAPLLGKHEKTVRSMCERGLISCRVTYGPKGQARYQISDRQIAAFNKRHTKTAA